jgi:hypothetical protein
MPAVARKHAGCTAGPAALAWPTPSQFCPIGRSAETLVEVASNLAMNREFPASMNVRRAIEEIAMIAIASLISSSCALT